MARYTHSEPAHQPRDLDFHNKVASSFAKQKVMQTLAIDLAMIEPGYVEMQMPYCNAFTQQHGFLHAGIVTTALDSACGYAAFSLMDPEAEVLTAEFKTNLLAPAKGERFLFCGQVLKPGKTLTISEARAYSLIGENEPKLIASMTATLMAVYA